MWISSVRDGPNPSQSIQDVNKDPKITELGAMKVRSSKFLSFSHVRILLCH